MEHDEFIGQVQNRARLGSRGDAERATWATLETLAERMADGAAQNLAAQLPNEIGEHLRRNAPAQAGTGEQFSLDEFFDRVTEREGIDQPDAVFHARVVLEVTDEATTGGVDDQGARAVPGRVRPALRSGQHRADAGRRPRLGMTAAFGYPLPDEEHAPSDLVANVAELTTDASASRGGES